ncbi:Protein NifX [Rhodovastum atsumiense]|uniref:Nitrogen fixation protein NifX n=1 Tax=Rhodovastum atsumiense TaxID=504468 RepID=A0A5M6IZ52_9PROT|nr:nitrogen fixation protein NifX [Rhodovastum atsumiense]KAA5613624.1 nitrogen fixation protein NifX [Rhodovastum atsumiense]CAH2599528.1 Protein NifX [Rhodovastum atsumiense]
MLARRLTLIDPEPAMPLTPSTPHLRVAIATNDLKSLNAHFGSARRFAIYDVTPKETRFIEAVSFDDVSDESGAHVPEGMDRIGPKVAALTGCHLLFVLAIGGPAAAKVVGARIHPVKLATPETIESILGRVQGMMTGNPPPWLRKVMALQGPPRSMDFLDEES